LLGTGVLIASVAQLLGLPGGWIALAWVGAVTLAAVTVLLRGQAAPPADLEVLGPPALVHGRETPFRLRLHASARSPARLEIVPQWPEALQGTPARLVLSGGPGDLLEARVGVLGRRRGRHGPTWMTVWSTDRAGLVSVRSVWPGPQTLEVHPAAAAAGGRRARRLVGRGRHAVRRTGTGADFASLRPYVPGDDPRAIHWPATARHGRPVIRRFAEEQAQQVVLAVDCSRRMAAADGPLHTRLDRAIEAGLSLVCVASDREDRVGAVVFSRKVLRTCLPGRASASTVARMLFDVAADEHEPDYAELFRTLRDRLRRRTLVVLLTDLEEPRAGVSSLERALPLLAPRHLVVCAAVGERQLRTLAGLAPDATPIVDADDLHARAAALDLLARRSRLLDRLRAAGAWVVDADSGQLREALLGGYSGVKRAGVL